MDSTGGTLQSLLLRTTPAHSRNTLLNAQYRLSLQAKTSVGAKKGPFWRIQYNAWSETATKLLNELKDLVSQIDVCCFPVLDCHDSATARNNEVVTAKMQEEWPIPLLPLSGPPLGLSASSSWCFPEGDARLRDASW